jgi:hypothetical protein
MSSFSLNTSIVTNTDSIVYVTPQDIKYANLIFIEHQQLKKDKIILLDQLKNYEDLNKNLLQTDSIRILQLSEYSNLNNNYLQQINELNSTLKSKSKVTLYWKIGGITVSAGLLLLLLLK